MSTSQRASLLAAALLGALGIAACNRAEPPPPATQSADPVTPVAPAPVVTPPPLPASPFARISGGEGGAITGELRFEPQVGRVHVSGSIAGLAPDSEHGFHVHETGDCSAPAGGSAGKHYNPAGQPHGGPDAAARHLGDLPNLHADASGIAAVDAFLADVGVDTGGDRDLVGRAVIVHEGRDDYSTQPSGDSGTPIACGIIEMPTASNAPTP